MTRAPGVNLLRFVAAVTYAALGYGDMVPPDAGRLRAVTEGLTGMLMGG